MDIIEEIFLGYFSSHFEVMDFFTFQQCLFLLFDFIMDGIMR